jgi:hypothetical protein
MEIGYREGYGSRCLKRPKEDDLADLFLDMGFSGPPRSLQISKVLAPPRGVHP